MEYNIFISYSEKDVVWVEYLQNRLSKLPINIFFAKKNISYGENIPYKILDAIKKSDLFILVWSKNSSKSNWVNQEIGVAINNKIKILPLILNDISLKGFLHNLKGVTLYDKKKHPILSYIRDEVNYKKYLKEEKVKEDRNNLIKLGLGGFFLYLLSQNNNNSEEE